MRVLGAGHRLEAAREEPDAFVPVHATVAARELHEPEVVDDDDHRPRLALPPMRAPTDDAADLLKRHRAVDEMDRQFPQRRLGVGKSLRHAIVEGVDLVTVGVEQLRFGEAAEAHQGPRRELGPAHLGGDHDDADALAVVPRTGDSDRFLQRERGLAAAGVGADDAQPPEPEPAKQAAQGVAPGDRDAARGGLAPAHAVDMLDREGDGLGHLAPAVVGGGVVEVPIDRGAGPFDELGRRPAVRPRLRRQERGDLADPPLVRHRPQVRHRRGQRPGRRVRAHLVDPGEPADQIPLGRGVTRALDVQRAGLELALDRVQRHRVPRGAEPEDRPHHGAVLGHAQVIDGEPEGADLLGGRGIEQRLGDDGGLKLGLEALGSARDVDRDVSGLLPVPAHVAPPIARIAAGASVGVWTPCDPSGASPTRLRGGGGGWRGFRGGGGGSSSPRSNRTWAFSGAFGGGAVGAGRPARSQSSTRSGSAVRHPVTIRPAPASFGEWAST